MHDRCRRLHGRIDARGRRRQGLFARQLVPAHERFAPLIFPQLLFLHQEAGRGTARSAAFALLAGTLVAPAAIAVAAAAIAAPAAPLLILAFARATVAGFARLAFRPRRPGLLLLRLVLLSLGLSRLWRLLLALRLSLRMLRTRSALLRIVPAAVASIATLLLAVAATLLEARLLLAIAMLVAPAVASTATSVAALAIPSIAAAVILLTVTLLVAARVALARLPRLRRGRGYGSWRRRRGFAEQSAEQAAEEAAAGRRSLRLRLRCCGHGLG